MYKWQQNSSIRNTWRTKDSSYFPSSSYFCWSKITLGISENTSARNPNIFHKLPTCKFVSHNTLKESFMKRFVSLSFLTKQEIWHYKTEKPYWFKVNSGLTISYPQHHSQLLGLKTFWFGDLPSTEYLFNNLPSDENNDLLWYVSSYAQMQPLPVLVWSLLLTSYTFVSCWSHWPSGLMVLHMTERDLYLPPTPTHTPPKILGIEHWYWKYGNFLFDPWLDMVIDCIYPIWSEPVPLIPQDTVTAVS